MRRSAELIGIDAHIYRIDDIYNAGTYTSVKVVRVSQKTRCPRCGHIAHIHSSARTTVYHIPYAGAPCLINLKKRRYRCPECNKTFAEDQPLLSRLTPHVSQQLEAFILDELSRGRTIAELEHVTGASKNIIAKIEASTPIPKLSLPRNLCIDEVKAFPKRIAIRKGEPHMACCIYDADKKTLIDMLAGDDPKTVSNYLLSFSRGERNTVETISCDLNGSYIRLAEDLLPRAVIYADKFHVAKLVTGAVDNVRKRLSHTIEDDGKYTEQRRVLRRTSKLMLTRKNKLKKEKQRGRVRYALETPQTDELRKAYLVCQLFFEWSDKTYESRTEMELALKQWISLARRAKVPEVRSTTKTINKRMPYILNSWEYGRTNAVAESLNRQIKDIIRKCRGFMSFAALRRRCMLVLGHEREPNKPIPLFIRSDKRKKKCL